MHEGGSSDETSPRGAGDDLAARIRRRVAEVEAGGERPRWDRGRRRSRQRFENLVLFGVAVSVVVIVAVAVVGRHPSGAVGAAGDPSASEPAAIVSSTVAPTSTTGKSSTGDASTGDAVIPRSWRTRCRRAPSLDPAATEAWVCGLRSTLVVEIRRFDEPAAVPESVRRLAGPLRSTEPRCHGVVPWSRPVAPLRVLGEFSCGRGVRGAELVWSVTGQKVVVRAIAADGDTAWLFEWWDRAAELAATL